MSSFSEKYRALKTQVFSKGVYSIVPIRYEDRMNIMKWRNEQIYHLRQIRPLTKEDQDIYFNNVISKLFNASRPNQILFSYLFNDECIGYGGLVHMNWFDCNAEISFIMNTKLEKEDFHKHWRIYLDLIEQVAFDELGLHKIYTYAFDLRPYLYEIVEAKGFTKEAELKEHCHVEGKYKSVVIHSKFNPISIRETVENDAIITYKWANDELTRKNSFSSDFIPYEVHEKWWHSKINNIDAKYFICEIKSQPAGIVRFDKNNKNEHFTIGITIAPLFRGKGLASRFLKRACAEFFKICSTTIDAYIKKGNLASVKSFEKAGFIFADELDLNGEKSLKYQLKKDDE